jgi:hypothetical protein
VLGWAYPLVGPGPERLLVLITDASQVRSGDGGTAGGMRGRVYPGFALHTEFPQLGYPVPEITRHDRGPVTPDRGVPTYVERRARLQRAGDPQAATGDACGGRAWRFRTCPARRRRAAAAYGLEREVND